MYGGGSREVVSDSTKGGRIEARRKAGFPWSGLRKQFIRQWSRCERRTLLTSALALVFVCLSRGEKEKKADPIDGYLAISGFPLMGFLDG